MRRTAWGLGGLLVVLLLLVVLAPTLAGWWAPSIVARRVNDQIKGRVEVGGASFSWLGGQDVGPVTVTAPDGKQVAKLNVRVSRGVAALMQAALGWRAMDLGTLTVTGEADIVRRADGTTNLSEALAPRQAAAAPSQPGRGGGSGEVRLPPSLSAMVVLDKVDVHYLDEGHPGPAAYVELPGLSGTATISQSQKAALDIAAAMRYGPAPGGALAPGGMVTVSAKADSLTDGTGRVVPEQVKVEAKADATDVAVAAADALAGMGGKLTGVLGEKLKASLTASGTLREGSVTVQGGTATSRMDLALRAAGGVITTERPGVLELNAIGAAGAAPAVREAVGTGKVELEKFPSVKVVLDGVRVPSAALTGGADLRGASGRITVDTTEIAGRVRVPEGVAGAQEGELRPFRVEPIHAEIGSQDLARGLVIKASTAAALAGESAGTVRVDMTAGGLLDSAGRMRGGLPALEGKAEVAGVSTAIAQPLVEGSGIDLPHGIGPKVDVVVTASSAGAPAAGGTGLPETTFDLQVKSDGATVSAPLVLAGRSVRTRDAGASVSLKAPAALLGAAARKNGVELTGNGYARASIKDLNLAWDEAGTIDGTKLTATVDSELGALSLRPLAPAPPAGSGQPAAPPQPSGDAIAIQQVFLTANLKQGATPRVDLKGSGSQGAAAFFAHAGFDLPGLREALAATLAGAKGEKAPRWAELRPVGSVELRNLPVTLATMTMKPPAPGERDTRKTLQDIVGPAVTVKLDATAPGGGDPTARQIALNVSSARLQGDASASVDSRMVSFKGGQFTMPELPVVLLELIGSQMQERPTLAGPSPARLVLEPLTIPMESLRPRLDQAGDARVRLELVGPAVVQHVVLAAQQGKPARDIGPVGLKDVLLSATVPVSTLAPGGAPKPARTELTATLLGDAQQVVGTLKGAGEVTLAAGSPSRPAKGSVNLDVSNTAKLDQILDSPGLVSGAVGERLKVDASGEVEFAQGTSAPPQGVYARPESPAAPAAAGGGLKSLNVRANIASPRLNSNQPLVLTSKGDTASLEKASTLNWNVDHAWANRFLSQPAPASAGGAGGAAAKQALMLTADTPVTISLYKLTLALGGGGIMKPGVFAADAEVAAPSAAMSVSGAPATMKNLKARAASGREPNVLGFSLKVDDMGGGPAPGGGPAVDLAGGLYGIADAAGNPTLGKAKLTASGKANGVPTVIVDALASQEGLLVQALGPTVNATLDAKGFSMEGGTISVDATSDRATAKIAGTIQNKTFIPDGTENAKLLEISPDLGRRITKGLPMIGEFVKLKADEPAVVTGQGLQVPMDGDWRKLNGTIRFDPGVARYSTNPAFAKLLKVIGQESAGQIGHRLEPLNVTARSGVLTYEKYKVPLGQFSFETRGSVDLVNKQLDVITYVPLGALTDEAAGVFNSGLGKLLGGLPVIEQATMVPIRTSGSFNRPETRPDLEVFVKEAGQTLLRPGQAVGGGLEELLKKIGPKEKPRK